MSLTTVVMTRDRREVLLEALGHLAGPVVVVDNASRDGTVAAVRALGRSDVHVVALRRNIGAAARNIGVRASRTPLVAFADDDSWWAPGALERASELFEQHPRLGLLAARILVGPEQRLEYVCRQMAGAPLGRSPDLPGPDVMGFVACGAVVRREAFLAAGGFDDVVFFAGEEERLALDLAAHGWGQAYVDEVVACHHPSDRGDDNRDARLALVTRNHLLTAIMRRPWSVVRHRALSAASATPAQRRGVAMAVPRLPQGVRHRAVVPPSVEERALLLER